MKTYDVLVVGSGTAGQTAAYELRGYGLEVALADNSGRPGGVCALAGCQAKKYFYEVTEAVARAQHLIGKGIQTSPVGDWAAILDQKNAFTVNIPDNTINGLNEAGIDYYEGTAHFIDSDTIAVDDEPLKPRYVVLATGATPMPLSFDGSHHLLTSDQFLDLRELPRRIVFIGGGFISFEFAHFAARLAPIDRQITVLEVAPRPLGPFDSEMVDLLVTASADDGIDIRCNLQIESIDRQGDTYTVHLVDGSTIGADMVVHGAGRVPNIASLALRQAGVEHDRRGITTDAQMRTTHPRIFAVGDCAATPQLARVADYEALVAATNILAEANGGKPQAIDYQAVPAILFSYPQLGMVGQTEDALKQAGTPYIKGAAKNLRWPTYRRIGMEHAAYKVLVDPNQHILGAHFLSDNAAGLVNTVKHAILNGQTVDDLYNQSIMTPYPSRESDLTYMLKPLLKK
jgi:glutathione reductase (NADPH)